LIVYGSLPAYPAISITKIVDGILQPSGNEWYPFYESFFCADDYFIYGLDINYQSGEAMITRYPYN